MPKPKSKVHAAELTPRQRIGRTQLQLAIAGRDQFGRKFTNKEKAKLMNDAALNIIEYEK